MRNFCLGFHSIFVQLTRVEGGIFNLDASTEEQCIRPMRQGSSLVLISWPVVNTSGNRATARPTTPELPVVQGSRQGRKIEQPIRVYDCLTISKSICPELLHCVMTTHT